MVAVAAAPTDEANFNFRVKLVIGDLFHSRNLPYTLLSMPRMREDSRAAAAEQLCMAANVALLPPELSVVGQARLFYVGQAASNDLESEAVKGMWLSTDAVLPVHYDNGYFIYEAAGTLGPVRHFVDSGTAAPPTLHIPLCSSRFVDES